MKERLVQKQKLYNQLQGKPVEKTSEEKEKERREKKKANKAHKFTDPITRSEPLKFRQGWSRRIDKENRLVFDIVDGKLYIASCRGHYED